MPFLSEEDRKAYNWKFGLLLGIFFVCTFVVPQFSGLFMPQTYQISQNQSIYQIDYAMQYQGRKYLVVNQTNPPNLRDLGAPVEPERKLVILEGSTITPVNNVVISKELKCALADERGIWLLYPDHYDFFDSDKVTRQDIDLNAAGDFAAASDGSRIYITFPNEIAYIEAGVLSEPMPVPEPAASTHQDQLLFYHNQLWHFAVFNDDIHYQTIENGIASEWQPTLLKWACKTPLAGFDSNGIFLISVAPTMDEKNPNLRDLFRQMVKVSRPDEQGRWQVTEQWTVSLFFENPKVISSEQGNAVLVGTKMSVMGWGLTSIELTRQAAAAEKGFDLFGFLPKVFWQIIAGLVIFQILSVIALVLIADHLMRKHRITGVILLNGKQYEFASMARRGFAYAIDSLLIFLPALFAAAFIFLNHGNWLWFISVGVAIAGLMVSAFLGFVYFPVFEGVWGQTLGKKVLGIRVVNYEGNPCGFWRAFLRNLCRIVDSFFNYAIGVALIGLRENWQRLGDMAAKTVVIRAEPSLSAGNR